MARRCAQASHIVPLEVAAAVDAVIAPVADRLSLGRLETLIAATWQRLERTDFHPRRDVRRSVHLTDRGGGVFASSREETPPTARLRRAASPH